ncbi:MAG TPA: hypothetical protein VNZ03_20875 [Terriglobales bacterium]|nr:hypothetical protein [Terriglobales bacterium]
MLSPFWKFFAVAVILTAAFLPVNGEQPARSPLPGTTPPGSPLLQHPRPLTQSSGYIFAGTVQSIERAVHGGNGVATVKINFHVDQGMRGVRTGQKLAIREWAGLWQSGERYRPGERVLLFLYSPSKLGLTSPVQGPMGRFRIGPDGQVVFDPGRIGVPTRPPAIGDTRRGPTRVSPREFVRLIRSAEEE